MKKSKNDMKKTTTPTPEFVNTPTASDCVDFIVALVCGSLTSTK